jgi:hypothetical protein
MMQAATADGGWAFRRPAQIEGSRQSRREGSLTTKQVRPSGERRKTHRLLADWESARHGRQYPEWADDPLAGSEELRSFAVTLSVSRGRGAVSIDDVGEAFLRHMRGPGGDGEAGLYAAATVLGVLRWHAGAVVHMHKPAFEGATVFNHGGDRIKYRCLVLPFGGGPQPERCLGVASWTIERQDMWLGG